MTARELRRVVQAEKTTERVEVRGIEQVGERDRGLKPGEARAKIRKSRLNLKLSLRGNVEIQAQHWVRKPVRRQGA